MEYGVCVKKNGKWIWKAFCPTKESALRYITKYIGADFEPISSVRMCMLKKPKEPRYDLWVHEEDIDKEEWIPLDCKMLFNLFENERIEQSLSKALPSFYSQLQLLL